MNKKYRGLSADERITNFSSPEPNSGCWLWEGGLLSRETDNTYGVARKDGERILAHRLSYETFRGVIPPGMLVCHHCDMPCCVNPTHLFVGTNQDNFDDMIAKDRGKFGIGRPTAPVGSRDILPLEVRLKIKKSKLPSKDLAQFFEIPVKEVVKMRARFRKYAPVVSAPPLRLHKK